MKDFFKMFAKAALVLTIVAPIFGMPMWGLYALGALQFGLPVAPWYTGILGAEAMAWLFLCGAVLTRLGLYFALKLLSELEDWLL